MMYDNFISWKCRASSSQTVKLPEGKTHSQVWEAYNLWNHATPNAIRHLGTVYEIGCAFFWHLTTTYHFSDHSVAGLTILNCRILSFVVVFSLFGVNFATDGYKGQDPTHIRFRFRTQDGLFAPHEPKFLLRIVLWKESFCLAVQTAQNCGAETRALRNGDSAASQRMMEKGPSLNHKWHQTWMHWI